MTNMNDRGVLHRKRRMMALRSLLGFADVAPISSGLAFAAVDEPTDALMSGLAQKAIAERQDTLLQCYASIAAEEVMVTVLVLRTPQGAELLPVELIERSKAKPLELITMNRKRCFSLDSRWQLRERKVLRQSRLKEALAAAQVRHEAMLENTNGEQAKWDPQIVIFQNGPDPLATNQ